MPAARHHYEFRTRWRVVGTPAEVLDVLADVDTMARWCPAVYTESRKLRDGDADHVGAAAELVARGFLGYALRFRLTITEATERRCAFTSVGDLAGAGAWELTRAGEHTLITFDWRVRLEKPLLRRSPAVLRPVFAANHDWAMAHGERALRLELSRRRAGTAVERAAVPAPPTYRNRTGAAVSLSTAIVVFMLVRRAYRAGYGSRD